MATRSTISLVTEQGVTSIYCHWDGYISHNGAILLQHYTDIDRIKLLLSYGNLSVLGKYVIPQTKNHTFDEPEKEVCVYYGRDRGEKDNEAEFFNSYKEFMNNVCRQEFNYIYRNNCWYYFTHSSNRLKKVKIK